MTEITQFVALAFDFVDGDFAAVESVVCASPAIAIRTAQGQWKLFGHTGAVAFSRTGDPATGDFNDAKVIKKFGDVPDDL